MILWYFSLKSENKKGTADTVSCIIKIMKKIMTTGSAGSLFMPL